MSRTAKMKYDIISTRETTYFRLVKTNFNRTGLTITHCPQYSPDFDSWSFSFGTWTSFTIRSKALLRSESNISWPFLERFRLFVTFLRSETMYVFALYDPRILNVSKTGSIERSTVGFFIFLTKLKRPFTEKLLKFYLEIKD